MHSALPDWDNKTLVKLAKEAIERCRLDLSGAVVLTEAATGAYRVTPVLAAMAGAVAVYAVTRSSLFGTFEQVVAETRGLAGLADVADRLTIVNEKRRDLIEQADIITNSGHVRPIDAQVIGWMKPSAVVTLMYEAWELRDGEIDLEACRRRGIRVAGINERHPAVDVFPYLGKMAVKLLTEAGVVVRGSRVLLLCDNPFEPFIRAGLSSQGACVEVSREVNDTLCQTAFNAVLVALRPGKEYRIGIREAATLAKCCPGAIITQLWGDLDRKELKRQGFLCWPERAPAPGHMGILLSDVGPEAVVRLQAGGLKVGEVLRKTAALCTAEDLSFLDEL